MSSDLSSDFESVEPARQPADGIHEIFGDDIKDILDKFEQDKALSRTSRTKIEKLIKDQYPSARARTNCFTDLEPHYITLKKRTIFINSPASGNKHNVPLVTLRTTDIEKRTGVPLEKVVAIAPHFLKRFEDAIRSKSEDIWKSMDSMGIDLNDLTGELLG